MAIYKNKISHSLFILLALMLLVIKAAGADEFKYPYNSPQARDPLMSLVNSRGEIIIDKQKEASALNLEGIIYTPPQSQVIINNQVYQRGDKIKGRTIIKIREQSVVVEKKNGELTIMKWEE
jgi:hypothetical protein